ncbi:hypothetical protein DAI22_04g215200 [Oryza sativa Japonica Group]|jgi:hypothetical protein|nr:hypothetical protein DAI22_04g215200 [Oryza sativa Japonica Group]
MMDFNLPSIFVPLVAFVFLAIAMAFFYFFVGRKIRLLRIDRTDFSQMHSHRGS